MSEYKIPKFMHSDIRELIHLMVEACYKTLEADGRSGSLSAIGLERSIQDYGRQLVDLPEDAFDVSGAVAYLRKGSSNQWTVDLPLWTFEEGRSDLSIFLYVTELSSGKLKLEITDIYVP